MRQPSIAAILLALSLLQGCATTNAPGAAEPARAYQERQCHPIIEGRVVDHDGHPVPDATVVVAEERSSIDRRRPTTDAQGRYHLEYVNLGCPAPNSISVLVCARGFLPRKATAAESHGAFRFEHALKRRETIATDAASDTEFQRECVRLAKTAPARPSGSTTQARVPRTIAPPHMMTTEEREARRAAIGQEVADTSSKLSALDRSGGRPQDRAKLERDLEISRLALEILDRRKSLDAASAKRRMDMDLKIPGVKEYLRRWAAYIRQTGERYLANEGSKGRVQVAVTIARDGSLQETEITGSSGDLKVDAAALAVVRHAAPFERFPAEIGDLAEIHAVSILQFEPAAR